MASILVDTNLLVYAYDPRDPVKNIQAQTILKALHSQKVGYLSVQSLAEFVNAARKIAILPETALQYAQAFVISWSIFALTPQIVLEAARGVRDYKLAYYDAQIWATAHLNQIPVIFSEDFNPGSTLEGVRFVNPFVTSFRIEDWV
ncbi:MAG: PIN domain-containing protein [Caldilineaceae bacterium]